MRQAAMDNVSGYTCEFPAVTEELLGQFVHKILSVGNPLKIVFFGSRARGDHKPDSDIDILIIEDSDNRLDEMRKAYRNALRRLYPEQTILVYPISEVEQWKYVPSYITSSALAQGRVLYEDSARMQALLGADEGASLVAEGGGRYKTPADIARFWFESAEEDLIICKRAIGDGGPHNGACFHAQQAAEKCLKGFLSLHSVPLIKTHELKDLVDECVALLPMPELSQLMPGNLSAYYINTRYDSTFRASAQDAREAYEIALRLFESVLAHVPPDARPR